MSLNIIKYKLFFLFIIVFGFDFTFAFYSDLDVRNCLKRQCYPELGCFSRDSFIDEIKYLFKSRNNLINALTLKQKLSICPLSPDVMNVTFLLFTKDSKKSQTFAYNPTKAEIRNSKFSRNRPTVMIIHGYTDSYIECELGNCQWMAKIKNYFLEYDYNVIAVDWSKPALDVNYFNSAFNTQIVGSIVAYFIRQLIAVKGAQPGRFHLVGHSLGAHVSGFVGKRFNSSKIGHITGLDPAGPGFNQKRLSPEDANLVVCIHTSAGILKNVDENIGENPVETLQLSGWLGSPDPLGHFDFWPNGGNGQPGCEKLTKDFFDQIISEGISGLVERGSCNHERATHLPTAEQTLRNENSCQLIGYECDSYDDFTSGKCADCGADGHQCKPMEFFRQFWDYSDNWKNSLKTFPNNYYIQTTDKDPFCLFHYQIVMKTEESLSAGRIKIKLIGRQSVEIMFNKPISGFKSGQTYTQLYTDSQHLGRITEADVQLNDNIIGKLRKFSKKINFFRSSQMSYRKIESIAINFMSHIDRDTRQQYSSELTPDYDNADNENENYIKFRQRK